MKKFSICLFLIFCFSAVVFYLGWVQIKVKPDSIGIIVSKTGGIDESPVIPGEFRWAKEFLLPTNAQLLKFQILPVSTTKTVSGNLPGGEVYTAIYNSEDNFSYKIEYNLSVTVGPAGIVKLLQENKISNQEDFELYLQGAADTIVQLASNYLLEKSRENPKFRPESVRRDDLFRSINVYEEFPEIELSIFAIKNSKLPDFELYNKIKTDYLQNMSETFIKNNNASDLTEDLNLFENENDIKYDSEEL